MSIRSMLMIVAVAAGTALFGGESDREYVRDLTELLSIPSVSCNVAENDRATGWMREFLERHGVWCAVETWPVDGRKVLYAATRPGLKNPDYTLVTHLDVVAAMDDSQFRPRLEGTRLHARGACDTKAVAYAAALILVKLNGVGSVGCVFSADEEIGGKTTKYMVDKGYGVPGKMVFVFDGGGKRHAIKYACKGNAYFKVTAKGKSGHSSVPEKCDNPFYKLSRAALKIESDYPSQKPGEWGNVASVTIMSGGDSQNRIPEEASMTVNVRFVEEGGLEKEREIIAGITGLDTEFIRGTPAAVSRIDDPEFARLRDFIARRRPEKPVELVRGTGANDSRYFPQFGKPMVCIGEIASAGAHAAVEWVDVATIGPHVDFVCDFMSGK